MSPPYSPTITTSRLTLRPLDFDTDIDFVYELFKPEFDPLSTTEKPYTPQVVLHFLQNCQKRHKKVAPPHISPFFYLVSTISTPQNPSEPVGLGLFYVRKAGLPGELAAYALPQYHRKGYAKEAGIALIEELKSKGVNEICGTTSRSNVPSQKLMEALGFEQKGTVRMMGWGKAEGVELLGYVLPGMKGFEGDQIWSMTGEED